MKQDPLQPKECAERLFALAAPERLRIVRFLRDGPHSAGEIADMLKIKPVNVSHHLKVLRGAGLVESEKKGRFVMYSLVPGLLDAEDGDGDRLNLGCCCLELPASGQSKRAKS
jgi:DNA-binding transcriptional ArsR family regulator